MFQAIEGLVDPGNQVHSIGAIIQSAFVLYDIISTARLANGGTLEDISSSTADAAILQGLQSSNMTVMASSAAANDDNAGDADTTGSTSGNPFVESEILFDYAILQFLQSNDVTFNGDLGGDGFLVPVRQA